MEEDTARPLLRDGKSPDSDIELKQVDGSGNGMDDDKSKEENSNEPSKKVKVEDIRRLKQMALRGNAAGVKIMLDMYEGDVIKLVNGSEEDGWSVLHSTVRGGTVPVIMTLIAAGADVNIKDADGATPLHCAAGYRPNDNSNVMQCLVERGADLGIRDKYGNTPLHEAIRSRQITLTEYILDHPIANLKYIEIKNKHDETALHRAAHYNIAVKMLVDKGADLMNVDGNGWTPLHYACANKQKEAGQDLLEAGKQQMKLQEMLQATTVKGDTPLHVAARVGSPSLIQLCFSHGADFMSTNKENKNPLHLAAEHKINQGFLTLFDPEKWLEENDRRQELCNEHLTREHYMEKLKSSIGNAVTQKDNSNHNCLDIAIKYDNEDVAMAIVKSKFCREALANPLCHDPPKSPMRRLIMKMPDVAEVAMTQCMKPVEDYIPDHMDIYQFIPSYDYIDDTWSIDKGDSLHCSDDGKPTMPTWKDKNFDERGYLLPEQEPYSRNSTILRKNHPLILMCTYNEELLDHKLVRDLIAHKWDSLGRYVYYTTLFIYVVFLVFFTGFTLTSIPPYELRNGVYNSSDLSPEQSAYKVVFVDIGRWIVIGLLSLYVLREVMEIYSWRASYFAHVENLIEWMLFISVILFVVDIKESGIRTDWQWQFGAVAIFLAWINLVLFIRKIPLLGIYIVMVGHILKTFMLFFPVFILFVAAFGLSFTVLLKNQYEFRSVGHSFMKTFVMMIGELDFTDIFFGYEENPEEHSHAVYYSVTSYIIFILFLVIMTIIIMNLLVGLAVDDIQGVQQSAEIRRLAMQVELVIDMEFLVPHNLYRRFIRHVPTGETCCPSTAVLYNPIIEKIDKILNPKRPPDPVLAAVEELQEQSPVLLEQGKAIREQSKMIQELQMQQERIMRQLVKLTRLVRSQEAHREGPKTAK